MEDIGAAKGWGDVNFKEPTEAELREMRLLKWVTEGMRKLKDDRIHPIEKITIKKHMPLALKHQFWDEQPIKKFLSAPPEKDSFILNENEMKAEKFQYE